MKQTNGESQVAAIVDPGRGWLEGAALPEEVDVTIIGGGIVGCSTAYFLAKRGLAVCLFEKGRIAGEQSGRNWGWVRQQGRAAAELPVMIRANQIWQEWQSEMDTGFEIGGCLYLANTQDELQEHEAWLEVAKQHGLATNIVHGAALDALLPGHGKKWAGALYTPNDGRAEPNRAAIAVATAAVGNGARVFERCAVRGLETQAGKIHRVVTEKGSVNTSAVLCAAGAWTSMFARSLDINVPQLKIKGNVGENRSNSHRSDDGHGVGTRSGNPTTPRWWLHGGPRQRSGTLIGAIKLSTRMAIRASVQTGTKRDQTKNRLRISR